MHWLLTIAVDIVSRFAYDSEPEDRGFLQPWYVVIRGAQTGVFKTWYAIFVSLTLAQF